MANPFMPSSIVVCQPLFAEAAAPPSNFNPFAPSSIVAPTQLFFAEAAAPPESEIIRQLFTAYTPIRPILIAPKTVNPRKLRYGRDLCAELHGDGEKCLCKQRVVDVRATGRAFNNLIAATAKLASLSEEDSSYANQQLAAEEQRVMALQALSKTIKRQLRPDDWENPEYVKVMTLKHSRKVHRKFYRKKNAGVTVTFSDSD